MWFASICDPDPDERSATPADPTARTHAGWATTPSPVHANDAPGPAAPAADALAEAFAKAWPAYWRWIDSGPTNPSPARARARLLEAMPELAPLHERLAERFTAALLARGPQPADVHDRVVRFLSLVDPPPLVHGCTQAIWLGQGGPAMVRNYDHAPHLCDALSLQARWLGRRTLAMTDCLWGALDGTNEHGLCVALAFGGHWAWQPGFAAPLLVRYALQTCQDAPQAAQALAGLPASMAYTFVCLDVQGRHATVYLAPGRKARIDHKPASANHQGTVRWPQHAASCRSVERLRRARALLSQPGMDLASLTAAFLQEPLHRRAFDRGSGTLYTAVYQPADGRLSLHWPQAQPVNPWVQILGRCQPCSVQATLHPGPRTPDGPTV